MIIEWLTSRFTPASAVARLIGYVDSSVALAHRYKRCKKAWASHLQACHQVILAERPLHAKNILVIGSGLLLEIPFKEMLQDPDCTITLVDMVHPLSVRRQARQHAARVELIELDVTGVTSSLGSKNQASALSALQFTPPPKPFNKQFDYVISANIISQLSLDPFERLRRYKLAFATDDFFVLLAEQMGQQHVDWLQTLGKKVLLIADVNRTYYDKSGQETEQVPSAYVTRDGKLIKSWSWLISPIGETARDFSYSMLVEARVLSER